MNTQRINDFRIPQNIIQLPLFFHRCHSFDHGDTGEGICRLSHHSAATLRGLREPYLKVRFIQLFPLNKFNIYIFE